MKQQKSAFTLIELIIGISISMILMLSIGVFITSGMNHILTQKNILDANQKNSFFQENIDEIFSAENLVFATGSASGFLLQGDGLYGKGDFVYLGIESQTGFCLSQDNETTTHIFLSQFFPFEGSNQTDDGKYKTQIFDHSIYQGTPQERVFGKGFFGNTGGFLNTPTGITSRENSFFVSDTGNNRILEFDENFENPKIFLDQKTLSKPTGLYFTGNSLYIVESEKGNILKYSSANFSLPPTLKVHFVSDFTQTATEMTLLIKSQSGTIHNLSQSGNISYTGTGTIEGGNAKYEFPEQNYIQGNAYSLEVSGLQGDFTSHGSYIAEIMLGNQKIFAPFFTNAEKQLTIFATGLTFPTGIYGSGENIVVNDFLERKKIIFDVLGNKIDEENMQEFDFLQTNFNPNVSQISNFVVVPDTFFYEINDKVLSLSFDYYSFYDCENLKNNIKKTMILKHILK